MAREARNVKHAEAAQGIISQSLLDFKLFEE
jgi:hypothetical protein